MGSPIRPHLVETWSARAVLLVCSCTYESALCTHERHVVPVPQLLSASVQELAAAAPKHKTYQPGSPLSPTAARRRTPPGAASDAWGQSAPSGCVLERTAWRLRSTDTVRAGDDARRAWPHRASTRTSTWV